MVITAASDRRTTYVHAEFRARLRPEILQGLDGPPVGFSVCRACYR
jgi:hypothetical protein